MATFLSSSSSSSSSAGSDYVGDNGTTVTFGPNDTSITVTIPTIDDDVYELEETFLGVLRSDTDTLLGISMASATIIDMDSKTSTSTSVHASCQNYTAFFVYGWRTVQTHQNHTNPFYVLRS